MKRVLLVITCCLLLISMAACNMLSTNSTHSNKPYDPTAGEVKLKTRALNAVQYEMSDHDVQINDDAYLAKLSAFSNKLYALCGADREDNYAFSPLSVYMAMAVLYGIGDEGVKADIRDLFGMTDQDIALTGQLFLSLVGERKYQGEVPTVLDINNSIWLDTILNANQSALDRLADQYYCRAYRTPFADDNAAANRDIRAFIKELTNDLIDQDFELSDDTMVAIINTLYFKDAWNGEGSDLETEMRAFNYAGDAKETEYLLGDYTHGVVQETAKCTYYYTTTLGGYRMKFILPKEGYTLADVMTADNLNEVNAQTKFEKDEPKTEHYTRCIFPSFNIESDTPLKDILQSNDYLANAFAGYQSDLVDVSMLVSDIKHKVVLNVNKEGIEGAAVTIIANEKSAYQPDKVKEYHDFVLDRAFGFLLTDKSGTVLFEGQVVNP